MSASVEIAETSARESAINREHIELEASVLLKLKEEQTEAPPPHLVSLRPMHGNELPEDEFPTQAPQSIWLNGWVSYSQVVSKSGIAHAGSRTLMRDCYAGGEKGRRRTKQSKVDEGYRNFGLDAERFQCLQPPPPALVERPENRHEREWL